MLGMPTPMPRLMGGGGVVTRSPATGGSGHSSPPWRRIHSLDAPDPDLKLGVTVQNTGSVLKILFWIVIELRRYIAKIGLTFYINTSISNREY
jgi:hypothetical protein